MQIVVDAHTHTLASGHAYSTVLETARAASENGMALLAITDHTPGLEDSPALLHFINFGVMDKTLYGVQMLYGAELDILDYDGKVSLPEDYLRRMDICIASIHPEVYTTSTKEENTRAILRVMDSPYVNIIGHPNNADIPVDYDALAKHAKETGTLLEVNNSTLRPTTHRKGTRETLTEMLQACMRHGTMVSLGSDAHFATAAGRFAEALALLEELHFPPALVASTGAEKFLACLAAKEKTRLPMAGAL